jgi:hypothetical protein
VQNVFCPFCTSVVTADTIQCPECGSDLSGVLSLIKTVEPEPTGAESQINVSLSDTAIAGDVNIVQQLQADTDDIVERLVDQLDCFDINKPGLSVPEGGFSRVDIEAAIPLVREDSNILKGMSSPHLVQFGKLLDSMGWPEVAKKVGKHLIERDDVQAEPLWLARSHLILARSSAETFDPAACIIHADKAAIAAKSGDLNGIEAYALYLSIDKRKDLAKDSSKQGERINAILESSGPEPGVAGAWCHLSLSRYLDAVNPDTAEHHEAMGFQHASNNSDLEAMVATLLATAENRIWTIKDNFWGNVKEESELNGLASYSMLVDLGNFVRSGSEHQLLAGIRTLTRHAKGRGMAEMQILASLVTTITDIQDLTSTTPHGSLDRQNRIKTILNDEKVSEGLDEILTRSYQGFDDSLFYQFALMDMTGTQLPRIARGYLEMERAYPNDSVKAMVLLYKGLHHAGNPAQEVIDNVADYLRSCKLGGDDVAWKLLSEIATHHSARIGEVPVERGQSDNFSILEEEPKLSKKKPLSALIFWFCSLVFVEEIYFLIRGDENSNVRYHLMARTANWHSNSSPGFDDIELFFSYIFIGMIVVSCLFSLFLFMTGSNQRKVIAITNRKKVSLLSLLILILIVHLAIIVTFFVDSGRFWSEDKDFDDYIVAFLITPIVTILLYLVANSNWANSWSGEYANVFHFPRLNLTIVLALYWIAMFVIFTAIHAEIVQPISDFEAREDIDIADCVFDNRNDRFVECNGFVLDDNQVRNAMLTEADFLYSVNLMLFSGLAVPLLFSGFTKKSLKVSAISILAVFAIFIAMFSLPQKSEIGTELLLSFLAVPLSYYVWMAPWPVEKLSVIEAPVSINAYQQITREMS